jgi:hypothetical protein
MRKVGKSALWKLDDTNLYVITMQKHACDFPILTLIAWDILAIPGVSISVERLFSSSKHALSDSMTAESASKTVAEEWLKNGLGENSWLIPLQYN